MTALITGRTGQLGSELRKLLDEKQVANRPKHSVIDLSKAKKLGFIIPTWKEALEKFNKEIK